MTGRRWTAAGLLALVVLPRVSTSFADDRPGLVVLDAKPGGAAAEAGLRAGDVLLAWRREAVPPANPEPAEGRFAVPADLDLVQLEEAPRGPTTVELLRDGVRTESKIARSVWDLEVRPALDGDDLARFDAARRLVLASDPASTGAGLAQWQELAEAWRSAWPERALWLELAIAARRATLRRKDALQAVDAARSLAERLGDATRLAQVAIARAQAADAVGDYAAARSANEDALARWRALRPDGMMVALCLTRLAVLASTQSRLDDAERLHREALELRRRAAPDSVEIGSSHNNLAVVAGMRGDYEAAEAHGRQALEWWRRVAPGTRLETSALLNLAIVLRHLGQLADAEALVRQAVATLERIGPDGIELARALDTLGNTLYERGHLREADALYARAVALSARSGTARDESIPVANQALLEEARGDRRAAAALHARALALRTSVGLRSTVPSVFNMVGLAGLSSPAEGRRLLEEARAILEEKAPDGIELAFVLGALGGQAQEDGRTAEAERLLQASLQQAQRLAPASLETGRALHRLGAFALAEGDLESAEARLREGLAVLAAAFPDSHDETMARFDLARAVRRRGRVDEARDLLAQAVSAIDSKLGRLGGSTETRSRYRASFADVHFELIDLLVEQGRREDAFAVLEAARARELLAAQAQRDVPLPDLPADLDRRRRAVEARYRRTLRDLPESALSARKSLLDGLGTLRRQLAELDREIEAASPAAAQLRQPDVLDLARTREALAPGTLLLSFAVGEEHGYLFAVGPDPAAFSVHRLAVGRARLTEDVDALRRALARPSVLQRWMAPAERLADVLLAPVSARIDRAARVLVLRDGPLQFVPFAALPVKGRAGRRPLLEAAHVHFAPSATVFAALAARRRAVAPPHVVAFADPDYGPSAGPPATDEGVRPREPGLRRLPGTRREGEALRAIFGDQLTLLLGRDATEERVKALGPAASHLHLACHGIVDPRSPLDSSLALSAPGPGAAEDGWLQAWEVVGQMRLQADLVVLSACDTALGEEVPGEGVLGLAQAFQLAGARTVLSTQWAVDDASTARLVARFYRGVRAGKDAASALRDAQLAARRRPATAHPYYWASFQLDGDWR